MIQTAHIIGMGKLGKLFASRMKDQGTAVTCWNRTPSPGVHPLESWPNEVTADAVFLAVSDDAIATVSKRIAHALGPNTLLVHHAGSVPKSHLGLPIHRCGVLWPPMTFDGTTPPDWSNMPLAVDAEDERLLALALALTPKAFAISEDQRRHLHLGAVLLGNLTAAWIGVVEAHLLRHGLDPAVLAPLAMASVTQAMKGEALAHVTGPAARNDRTTLLAQSTLLDTEETDASLRVLHHLLTHQILQHHGHPPLPPLQAAPEGH